MMAVNASRASAALLSSVGNDDAPAEPARPASRLDALEHKIQSEQVDPETGEVTEEGRTEEDARSEEHTSELQSLMRISYAVFCLKKKKRQKQKNYKAKI